MKTFNKNLCFYLSRHHYAVYLILSRHIYVNQYVMLSSKKYEAIYMKQSYIGSSFLWVLFIWPHKFRTLLLYNVLRVWCLRPLQTCPVASFDLIFGIFTCYILSQGVTCYILSGSVIHLWHLFIIINFSIYTCNKCKFTFTFDLYWIIKSKCYIYCKHYLINDWNRCKVK